MSALILLLCIAILIVATSRYKIHPFLVLILVALLYGVMSGMSVEIILNSFKEGFGNTLGGIGLVIVFGVMIGAFLEHTGAAFSIARMVLNRIGAGKLPVGLGLMGFVVSIPVFCDSAFILLTPLNKALTKKAGLSLGVTAIALAVGLLASHALVPPTPGPVAAAGIIGANIGKVILFGLIIGLLAMIIPIVYAIRVGSKFHIDPNPDLSESDIQQKLESGPPIGKSLLPIIIPILLILIQSFQTQFNFIKSDFLSQVVLLIGHPVIALMIGLFAAMTLPKKWDATILSDQGWIGKSMRDAASILLITGAGGIFGKVLQNSELPDVLSSSLANYNIGIWLPFIIAAALKTAQGSSTVAMVTTASIVAPLAVTLGLDSETAKVLMVLAIGAGSLVVSHAPDSYFWVVTQLSNMDVNTGYKLHTIASGLLGLSAMLLIWGTWVLMG